MSNQKNIHFADADRIIDKHELKKLTLYSHVHISRLEKAGNFPKRIKLGPNRVGWSLQEVQDWIEARKSERDDDTRQSDSQEGK